MTDIGTDFLDNKVTYDSNVPPSWIELVQSKTKIAAAETAEHVSGFNNAIAYRFFPGIPPPPEPTYFLATTKTEWKEGETVTVAGEPISQTNIEKYYLSPSKGPFDDQG